MAVKPLVHLIAFTCCVNLIRVLGERNITVDLGDNTRTDLKSYLADIRVAAYSVQYTADLNNRLIGELQKALDNDMVNCQANGGNVRPDYEFGALGVYYKHHLDRLTWNEARKSCSQEGARLAYYATLSENMALLSWLVKNGHESTGAPFLGVHRFFDKEDWVTSSSMSLSNIILPSQRFFDDLKKAPESEKCGTFVMSGIVQSSDCEDKRDYFCEIRLSS